MKRIALAFMVLLTATAAFGAGKLTLMQNKPEIDAQLKAYAATWGQKNGVTVVIKSIGGTSGGMGPQLKADYAAGDMPDIFAFDGLESFKDWEGIILDLSKEPWVYKTSVAFKYNGKEY